MDGVFQLLQIQCGWHRTLEDDACHARVYIKGMKRRQQFALGDIARVMPMLKADADLITGAFLVGNVEGYCRAVADIN